MKSRPESASIAMLSSYNDPAVPTTVFPDFKRSLTGFMRKNLQLPSPECESTPQSSPTSCGEQGDAGGYAAIGISSTSRSMSGYQRLKMAPSSPLSVRTRVCNNKCAPSLDHCICCFLQNRLLTTSFTVDSTNPVAIGSPLRYRSP